MEPKGWTLREAWDVSATPEAYRTYVQKWGGKFSGAKPACGTLQRAWVSDRTLCYWASGKPAVVQHTGRSRLLPEAEGLFRFRTLEEATAALTSAEADYERHAALARALVQEHFDARRVVGNVLERALEPRVSAVRETKEVDLPRGLLAQVLVGPGGVGRVQQLKRREYQR